MTVTLSQVGNNANMFFGGVWPYLLGVCLLILFLLVTLSIAISVFALLAGRTRRVMTFEEFDEDWKRRGSPIS